MHTLSENFGLMRSALDTSTSIQAEPQYCAEDGARKAVAIWLYQAGVCTLDETTAKFKANPEWRSA